ERRVEPLVVNQEDPAARLGDLHGAVGENILLGDVRAVARRPLDLHQVGRADGGRIRTGKHHHPTWNRVGGVLEREAADVTLHAPGGGIVDRAYARAVARRRNLWTGIDHAFDGGVDAVARRAVRLRRNVERLRRTPD